MASFLVGITRALLPLINRVHMITVGVKPVAKDSILSVELRCHKGGPVKLEDGCEVRPGDPVIKLHLNNAWIGERWWTSGGSGKRRFPRGLFHCFKEGLQILAQKVADGEYGDVVAVYGWTAFHSQATRLGFQVIDLPNTLRVRSARLHITALRQARRIPWLRRHASSGKSMEVKAVWLSRGQLLRIHGQAPLP
ncbi:MAG: YkoP family protein [Dehalococcoidia bacterium]